MKKYLCDFVRRGMTAAGFGPMILAVLYLILHKQGVIEMLTVKEVCLGIASLSALAFVAGGMNVVYQVEQLPLMIAILIHGCVLYVSYLGTYLLNGWLEMGTAPILVFTAVFVLGYLVIWGIIYSVIKRRTERINELLMQRRKI